MIIPLMVLFIFALILVEANQIQTLDNKDYNFNEEATYFSDPLISSDTPNSKPLIISQHAVASQSYYPLSLPTNVSFTLVEGWNSKNVTIQYKGVSQQKDRITNGEFTSNDDGWDNYSSDSTLDLNGWQSGGYVDIILNTGLKSAGWYAYYEQNISVPEILTSNKLATISMDYYYTPDGPTVLNTVYAYLAVKINGIEINKTVLFTNLVPNSWTGMSLTYDPILAGQNLPDNITIRSGLYVNQSVTILAKPHLFWLDNVEYKIWTKSNSSDLIKTYDVEFNENYTYTSTSFGEGRSFIDVERESTRTSNVIFTISKNVTGVEDFEIQNITITSNVVKEFNSTISGQSGSCYLTNGNITWNADISFIVPYGYFENWAEIKKPSDWKITKLLDGYRVDQIGNCQDTGFGEMKTEIPKSIFNPGLWSLEAISENYLLNSSLEVWNDPNFISESGVTFLEVFRINVTLNDSLSFSNTRINCSIYYPNGSILWHDEMEPSSPNVIFGNLIVGNNMSVGDYEVVLIWTNNLTYENRDKVGYSHFNFNVWHQTSLTPLKSVIETIAGDPLLVKVNFTDIDFNTFIDFGTITYNTSYGASGNLAYIGSGIYVIDLDTGGIPLGNYYLSFNASKIYYESITEVNLIQLTIIAQPLALEVPRTVIHVNASSYAVFNVNTTGAISGSLESTPNVTTDWNKPYSVVDHGDGTHTVNLSTYDSILSGVPEIFSVVIYANKTNYGITSEIVTIMIHPLPTIAKVNATMVQVVINDLFYLEVNYTIEETGQLISGANCSVTWDSTYNISTIGDRFMICFNTSGLSLESYTAVIQLDRVDYETAFKIVYVIMKPAPSVLSVINPAPIKFIKGDVINLSCYFLSGGQPIINCNITLLGDLEGNFTWNGSAYFFTINTQLLNIRNYFVQIYAIGLNIESQLKDVIFEVLPMEVEIQTEDTSIEYKEGEDNSVVIYVYDKSHGLYRTDLSVNYELEGITGALTPGSNNSFILDLNSLNLTPRTQSYSLKITIINPYGEDTTIIVSISVPVGETNIIFIIIIFGVILVGVTSAFIIKRRYIDMTKFQREIKSVKGQITKGKFEKVSKLTRDDIIGKKLNEIMPKIKSLKEDKR